MKEILFIAKIDIGIRTSENDLFRKLNNTRYGIIYRCKDPNHHNYKYYGAKGVDVCDRWVESFDNFLEDIVEIEGWDKDRYLNGDISLDKDLKKHKLYSKETCVWLSREFNHTLQGNNEYYVISPSGEKMIFSNISKFSNDNNISYTQLSKRLNGYIKDPYYRGWYIPKQKETNYPKRFEYKSPFYIKNVDTLEEIELSSIKDIAKYIGVNNGRLSSIRKAINPNFPDIKLCRNYLIRSSNTEYKSYNKISYIRVFHDGKEETITNISRYCRDNKLNLTCVSECIHGKQKTHKGSKFFKKEIKIS